MGKVTVTPQNKNQDELKVERTEHKNARSSHNNVQSKHGKVGLFGNAMPRVHAKHELLEDALDKMEASEGYRAKTTL